MPSPRVFELFLMKPSHYDDGYVIQWVVSSIPANTLAALNGLAMDCAARKVLGGVLPGCARKRGSTSESSRRSTPLLTKIRGFLGKAARAGVNRVFIGLENINPESLKDAH